MKKILSFILLGSFGLLAMAQQTEAEIKARINKIKRSKSYLSAEATMKTEEEAKAVALELLVGEINDWVASKGKSDEVQQIVLQDINSNTQQLDMKRGIQSRVFVYVKKKDIVLIYGEGQLVLNDEELQPLSAIASQGSNEAQETPAETEEPATQTPVAEKQPAAEEAAPDEQPATEPAAPQEELSPLQCIQQTQTMTAMKPVFAKLKGEGRITYGSYKGGELKENCYLLFYDRAGNIKAVVKKSGDTMTDTQNGAAVTLTSFSGMGAYWFVLNQ